MSDLQKEITAVLNRHSAENESDTPDFILAQYLMACLSAHSAATKERDRWYGHMSLSQKIGETAHGQHVATTDVDAAKERDPCPHIESSLRGPAGPTVDRDCE